MTSDDYDSIHIGYINIIYIYIYIIIININHGKSRSLTLIPGYDHFLILPFMYILGIIVIGKLHQPTIILILKVTMFFFLFVTACHSFFFFRENVQLKTLQYNACKHTMVTRYVSCNYLSQFLTVHCVTNYGNTQCFPVNNP